MRGDSSDECGGVGYVEVRGVVVFLGGMSGRFITGDFGAECKQALGGKAVVDAANRGGGSVGMLLYLGVEENLL